MVDQAPKFDKEQIARQQKAAGLVRDRAESGLNTSGGIFHLSFGDILDIADLFDKEIPGERRTILEQYKGGHLTLDARPYRTLSVRRMEREAGLWVELALGAVAFAQELESTSRN
ncbi:hypothetical protein M1146_02315 [Patescibacteria group bacterium]|nr:hypothetical protein [Patescibacteria group bacterium]